MKKRICRIFMFIICFVFPVSVIVADTSSLGEIRQFVNDCQQNCRRQIAQVYRYKDGQFSPSPDLVIFLVYNHPRNQQGPHNPEDIYGVVMYTNSGKPAWGMKGTDFKRVITPQKQDFAAFFKGAKVELVGEFQYGLTKELFKKIKNIFGQEGAEPEVRWRI